MTTTTTTLLKKDFRVCRAAVIAGAASMLAPYVVALVVSLVNPMNFANAYALEGAAMWGLALTTLTATAFGGLSFAAERRQRSAEFLAMIPVPRWRIVRSKLAVSLALLGAMAVTHLLIQTIAARWIAAAGNPTHSEGLQQSVLAATGVLLSFGVAWLASSMVESAVIAACVSIGVSVVGWIAAAVILRDWSHTLFGTYVELFIFAGYAAFALTLGVASIVVGRLIFIRRVAP